MKLSTILKQPRDQAWAILEELAEDGFELCRDESPAEVALRKMLDHARDDSESNASMLSNILKNTQCVQHTADILGISPYFVRKFAKSWGIPIPKGQGGPLGGKA